MLNAAADANQLQTRDQILAQAQRMIAVRDRTGPQLAAFHRHWLRMDDSFSYWWRIDHDTTKYPLYSEAAKATFAAELDNFFAEVAFTNGSFKDLFLSNVAFVNKDNAGIYGLSNSGTALTKVALDAGAAPGLPDPRRVLELLLALRFDGAHAARRVHLRLPASASIRARRRPARS